MSSIGISQPTEQASQREEDLKRADGLVWVALTRVGLGDYEGARGPAEEALKLKEKWLGEHAEVVYILNSIGKLYLSLGEIELARVSFESSHRIGTRILPTDHRFIGVAYEELGDLYYDQGDYQRAEEMHREALSLWRRVLGPSEPGLAISMSDLALDLSGQGRDQEAEEILRGAIAFARREAPDDIRLSILLASNHASVLEDLGQYDEAKSIYGQSIQEANEVGEEYLRQKADLMRRLANLHLGLVELIEHEELLLAAEKIYAQVDSSQLHASERAGFVEDYSDLLVDLSNYYGLVEDHQNSLAYAESALETHRDFFGLTHPGVFRILDRVAAVHVRLYRYDDARKIYEDALSLAMSVFGPRAAATILPLGGLANLESIEGNYQRAEELLSAVLEIRQESAGTSSSVVASTLFALASARAKQGDWEVVVEPFLEFMGIVKANPKKAGLVTQTQNWASLFEELGNVEIAQEALEFQLKLLVEIHGTTESLGYARTLSQIARLQVESGDIAAGEELIERSASIATRLLVESPHPELAEHLGTLADFYLSVGEIESGIELKSESIALTRELLGDQSLRLALYLEQAAMMTGNVLGLSSSEAMLKEALSIYEASLGPDNPSTLRAKILLAGHRAKQGYLDEATELARLVLESADRKGVGSEYIAEFSQTLLSLLLLEMGRVEDAKQGVNELLRKSSSGSPGSNITEAQLLWLRALIAKAEGDVPKWLEFRERQFEESESRFRKVIATGSEARKTAFISSSLSDLSMLAADMVELNTDNPQAVALVFTAALRTKGRVLDVVSGALISLRESGDADDRRLLREWSETVSRATELSALAKGSGLDQELLGAARELRHQQADLEEQIGKRAAALQAQQPEVTVAEVQAALPPRSALVEFVAYLPNEGVLGSYQPDKRRYLALVVTNQDGIFWTDLGAVSEIEQKIRSLRMFLGDPRSRWEPSAREVGEALLDPLAPLLKGANLLVLSPAGQINLIPFSVLPGPDGVPLLEKMKVVTVTSGRDLVRSSLKVDIARTDPLVMAAPDFGGHADAGVEQHAAIGQSMSQPYDKRSRSYAIAEYAPLPGAEIEGRTVAQLLPNSVLRIGSEATEAEIRQTQGPRVLHLATHGFFLEDQELDLVAQGLESIALNNEVDELKDPLFENPMLRSGLVFAGANSGGRGGYDGILTALEASTLDLAGTELVVMSACDTGLGATSIAQGVYGLRRALIMAGAKSQLSTLWKIEDDATREFMERFYGRLLGGEGRAEALQNVQLSFARDESRSHPFYWASFVLVGDWGPLSTVDRQHSSHTSPRQLIE